MQTSITCVYFCTSFLMQSMSHFWRPISALGLQFTCSKWQKDMTSSYFRHFWPERNRKEIFLARALFLFAGTTDKEEEEEEAFQITCDKVSPSDSGRHFFAYRVFMLNMAQVKGICRHIVEVSHFRNIPFSGYPVLQRLKVNAIFIQFKVCLLYTSDAADE